MSPLWEFRLLQTVTPVPEKHYTLVTWAAGLTKFLIPLGAEGLKVFALRQRAALFGHNAPDWKSMPKDLRAAYDPALTATEWPGFKILDDQIDLDAVYPKIVLGNWCVVAKPFYTQVLRVNGLTSVSRAAFALSSKITRIDPDRKPLALLPLRFTTVFAQSEELILADVPIDGPISGPSMVLAQPVKNFGKGRMLKISGREPGQKEISSRVVKLTQAAAEDDSPEIIFTPALVPGFERDSVTVNANVALATHGETKNEVLGSGDAGQSYQRFILKQPPLTFIHGSSASGTKSTLDVCVNEVLWHETPTLFGRGPRDRVFVTRTDDDGKTTVQFGDGARGARLPSGEENVRATYRKGIGLEGLVKAGQLSLLISRPLGVKEVINPADAEGADDRESVADARANAPLTVLTLDRIVSLRDYQDFVRCYAGVAKALATWTWDGRTRGVFITVAGPNGAEISLAGDFGDNLMAAIRQSGDPFVPVQVKSYKKNAALFHLAARVKVDPDYETASVLAAVEAALRAQFSFDARDFGQPVVSSEVIAVMQSVPGVVAVDLNRINRVGQSPSTRLLAALPKTGTDGLDPAELIVLDSAPLDQLEVML
jgi:hypothetical protein